MSITIEQAKALKPGMILHQVGAFNSDGTPRRWKVNGKVKTWKKDSSRVSIPIKHGLYAYDTITETSLHLVSLPKEI